MSHGSIACLAKTARTDVIGTEREKRGELLHECRVTVCVIDCIKFELLIKMKHETGECVFWPP